jgi:hypothetical protein
MPDSTLLNIDGRYNESTATTMVGTTPQSRINRRGRVRGRMRGIIEP